MQLSTSWQRRLRAREPDLVPLVMINPYGADPAVSPLEFGLRPQTVRVAMEPAHIAADGTVLPFGPWLLEWPLVEERYAPQDRRYEIAETSLRISGGAELARVFRRTGGGQSATCQVCLWSPGMGLGEAIVLLAGPVRGVPDASDLDGPVSLRVTDGDPDKVVEFPPGPITLAEFPEAPSHVVGVSQRVWVSSQPGPSVGLPWQLPCPQIDAEGRVFYVHEGKGTRDPDRFWNYGTPLGVAPRVEVAYTAASGQPYTRLVFPSPVPTPSGLVPAVSCAGGRGVEEANPALFLLETVGGYRLTPRARRVLESSPFLFDAMLNLKGDVRKIVAEQLIPQTDLVMTFRHGLVDVLPLAARKTGTRLALGGGLLYRLADQGDETELSSVYNAFDIRCGRNAAAKHGARVTIRRDANSGSDEIRALCARSQRAHGRREFPRGWEAFDLAVIEKADGTLICPAGELLGDVLVRAHALPYRPHSYRTSWCDGLALELGETAWITDPDEDLDDVEVTVTGRIPRQTGVDVTFSAPAVPAPTARTERKVYANA